MTITIETPCELAAIRMALARFGSNPAIPADWQVVASQLADKLPTVPEAFPDCPPFSQPLPLYARPRIRP